jgi:hypothetical protein
MSGVKRPCCGTVEPESPPAVAEVNGRPSETDWVSENEATSRYDPPAPASRPIRRCVSEYSTESRTIGRNGESTVSKRMMRF